MQTVVNLWPLIGVLVIVVGFVLRFNPLLVVTAAAIATGLAAHFPLEKILATMGDGFLQTRALQLILLLPLAVIGLLERHGLRLHAQNWIARFERATVGRLLIIYLFVRESTAAMGLTSLGGHPQMVRPLLAPMAEGAALNEYDELPQHIRDKIKAHAAACDNIAVFFGEDIFIAFGAVLLIDAFLKENGIQGIEPLHIGLWAIPTAIAALIIHMTRLLRLDASIRRDVMSWRAEQGTQEIAP